MHFCSVCKNMYYIQINTDNTNQLDYYCRHCGNKDSLLASENVCVSRTQIKKSTSSYEHIINKYTKYDPTLPHTNSMKCPKETCVCNDTSSKVETDIIYVRYDDDNMKYLYICTHCDTIWKTDDNK